MGDSAAQATQLAGAMIGGGLLLGGGAIGPDGRSGTRKGGRYSAETAHHAIAIDRARRDEVNKRCNSIVIFVTLL